MDSYKEEHEYKGYTIELVPDDNPESPRDWDNLGTMVCWHSRYNLGDEHKYSDYEDFLSQHNTNDIIMLPLYLYDHSGITIRTSSFNDKWDSGQVGFIYVTKDQVKKEYNVKRITKKIVKMVENVLNNEVKIYDQFLTGDIYGYIVKNKSGKELDSCWGFYGQDEALEEAKGIIEYYIQEDIKKRQAKTKHNILAHVPLQYRA